MLMQPLGTAFGYLLSIAFMLSHNDARTISIETGIQNYTFTITLITLMYTGQDMKEALMFPLVCGLFYFPWSIVTIILYNCYLSKHDTAMDNCCRTCYAGCC